MGLEIGQQRGSAAVEDRPPVAVVADEVLVKDSPVNGTSAPVFRLMSDS